MAAILSRPQCVNHFASCTVYDATDIELQPLSPRSSRVFDMHVIKEANKTHSVNFKSLSITDENNGTLTCLIQYK